MSKNDGNKLDMKNEESSHYLNNLTTAVNELFGLGKKEEMGATKTMSSEISESNGGRNEFRKSNNKSNLHVLPQDSSPVKRENIITEDTVIRGEVLSSSNINIAGSIKGAVSSEGDIIVTGKIYGNVKGNNITIKDGLVEGNILAKSDSALLGEATVVGDIEANNIVSEGKIKGNIKALNAVSLINQAVLFGNINAKNVNMQNGVILDGNIKIMGDVSIENLFQDHSVKKVEIIPLNDE
jgi:cytoskeletal protein CcmA (bactofilin family)